jgi:iron complex transport system ATP-binding protein
VIEARALSLEVPGRRLVSGLTFNLAPGDCCALLGRNGSGKSSLIASLAGLRRPASGTLLLEGRPLGSWDRLERARRLGVLLQDEPGEYWGSTADYVRLGRFPHRDPAENLVSRLVEELGLSAHAAQPFRTLSGGERQRARLAQLFAQDPAVLLLDEPLQHLDLAHQAAVMASLAARAVAGKAILMALHEPALAAMHCSHAVLLYDSERVAQGPADIMLTQENLESLYGCRLETSGPSFIPAVHRKIP